ncbi:MAG: hypothetical protein ACREM1_20380 [Longimicrobiales bacterium]
MTDPSAVVVNDRSSVNLDRVRSRERAVSRAFKGIVTAAIGWVANLAETPIGEGIFGAGRLVQEVWAITGRSLFWLGLLVAASAGIQHLRRFGGRRGFLAFASFGAAGACGLLAVAEQFETWFLDTHALQGLDIWGLAGVGIFGVLGGVLLAIKPLERLDAI